MNWVSRDIFSAGSRQEVNSTWYPEIEEPIKSREKHYLLVLYILKLDVATAIPWLRKQCTSYWPSWAWCVDSLVVLWQKLRPSWSAANTCKMPVGISTPKPRLHGKWNWGQELPTGSVSECLSKVRNSIHYSALFIAMIALTIATNSVSWWRDSQQW